MAPDYLNQVFLIGRTAHKPELRHSASRCPVATFILKVKRGVSSKERATVDPFRVIVWGEAALVCAQEIEQGDRVFVKGSLEVRSIPTVDSQDVEKFEVVAAQVTTLKNKP